MKRANDAEISEEIDQECGEQLFGVADFSSCAPQEHNLKSQAQYGVCLVDGVEIRNVWFIDTEAGIVKTFSLASIPSLPPGFEEGSDFLAHLTSKWPADMPIPSEVYAQKDGVMWTTLNGKVELFAPSDARRARHTNG